MIDAEPDVPASACSSVPPALNAPRWPAPSDGGRKWPPLRPPPGKYLSVHVTLFGEEPLSRQLEDFSCATELVKLWARRCYRCCPSRKPKSNEEDQVQTRLPGQNQNHARKDATAARRSVRAPVPKRRFNFWSVRGTHPPRTPQNPAEGPDSPESTWDPGVGVRARVSAQSASSSAGTADGHRGDVRVRFRTSLPARGPSGWG